MKIDQAHHAFLKELLRQLNDAGVGSQRLFDELARRGIKPSSNSLSVSSVVEGLVLLEAAAELTGDPGLMLRLGKQFGIAGLGSFGFALMSCADVRESVRLMHRYGGLLFQPGWDVFEHEKGLLLRARISVGTAAQQQLFAELVFSNLAAAARALYGPDIERKDGLEIQMHHPRPSHADFYQRVFNSPVKFDCEFSQICVPSQILDTPVRTASRSQHVVFQQQCEEMLRGLNSAQETTAAVRHLLVQSAGDFLDIAGVAKRLHISERTLRRRLEVESTSFRAVQDEIRDLLAREYLTKTELTVADIAHLLGYAETVSFRRAFTRWNGITPNAYRSQTIDESIF